MSMPQIAIFWDYENCRPSSNLSGSKLSDNIRRLVQGSEIVTDFKAYLNISLECEDPRSAMLHSELQSSGVTLVHCPHNGKKDVVDKMMIVDMLAFALVKNSPTTIVMITGDRDFSYAAAILKQRGHKIVVIIPPTMGHPVLKMQADNSFDWRKDVLGRNSAEIDAVDAVELASELKQTSPRKHFAPDEVHDRWRSESSETLPETMSVTVTNGHMPELETVSLENNSGSRCESPLIIHVPTVSPRLNLNTTLSSRVTFDNSTDRPPSLRLSTGNSDRSCLRLKSLETSQDIAKGACCDCLICLRSPEVVSDPVVDFIEPTGEQLASPNEAASKQMSPAAAQSAEEASASTDTPSSISSGNLSEESMLSSAASIDQEYLASRSINSEFMRMHDVGRFRTLLNVFFDHRTLTGMTIIRSSIVGSEMLKRDADVYKNAGVTRMKQYVEEARKANVLVTPGPDHGGSWLELNPVLYLLSDEPDTEIHTLLDPGDVFNPLIDRLREEFPLCRLLHSVLGAFLKKEYPWIYEYANVSNLSGYIKKAEERGIVASGGESGSRWVKLMPAYYEPMW